MILTTKRSKGKCINFVDVLDYFGALMRAPGVKDVVSLDVDEG